jgi:hypothetical protein
LSASETHHLTASRTLAEVPDQVRGVSRPILGINAKFHHPME